MLCEKNWALIQIKHNDYIELKFYDDIASVSDDNEIDFQESGSDINNETNQADD